MRAKSRRTYRGIAIALIAAVVVAAVPPPVAACSRVLYVAKDGTVITGRSMDWGEDMRSNMWVLPRGMKRDGMGGKNTVTWESKYGSLIVSAYDIGTADGMNEKGLVVSLLALVESDYGKPAEGGKVICMSTWPQYVLDNHATVAEAVADLRKESFRVQTVVLSTGRPANMHLAISDPTGDSAVFEYVEGKLVIHHGKQYKVMTNSPTYDKQLAIMEYWKEAGGLTKSLPGTSRAADRFVRASFLLDVLPAVVSPTYISGSPQQKFQFQAAMAVLSLVRSIGTPLGFATRTSLGLVDHLADRERQHQPRGAVRLRPDPGDVLGAVGRPGPEAGGAGEEAGAGRGKVLQRERRRQVRRGEAVRLRVARRPFRRAEEVGRPAAPARSGMKRGEAMSSCLGMRRARRSVVFAVACGRRPRGEGRGRRAAGEPAGRPPRSSRPR